MKRSPPFAVIFLLCLSFPGTACGDLVIPVPAYPGPETETPFPTDVSVTGLPITEIPSGTPISRSTSPPYPQPTEPTPTVPTTPPPKPTSTPTVIPTVTPPPTALPLPQSAFYVVWVENTPFGPWGELGYNGTIWVADPRDIANRREVVRFDGEEIQDAVLSPNGRQVALTTKKHWEQIATPLWVVNLDGSGLRQLAPEAHRPLWSQDNQTIFYGLGRKERGEQGWVGLERVDLAGGESQRILTIEPASLLHLLGWSAGGQWLYYLRRGPQGLELWQIRQDGSAPQFITSLGTEFPPLLLLSPGGSKILIGTRQGLSWISTDGQETGTIVPPLPRGWSDALWGHGENKVIVGQHDESQPLFHLYEINIPSQQARELATFGIPTGPGWDYLALAPDQHWLMAYLWDEGFYWIHLPTGTMVPIPCRCLMQFVAWVPRGTEP